MIFLAQAKITINETCTYSFLDFSLKQKLNMFDREIHSVVVRIYADVSKLPILAGNFSSILITFGKIFATIRDNY